MKTILSFFILFLVLSTGFAQKQDIEIFEKKEGSKTIVIARNVGKIDYTVSLSITASGMDVSPSTNIEAVIPAGFMKEMANLTPRPGESWEYGYDVSFTKSISKTDIQPTPAPQEPKTSATAKTITNTPAPAAPDLTKADIVLYSKPGCSRCSFVKKQLESQGIAFEEFNTASSSPEINNMWAQLRNSGFTGGSVTMPVVRANGKYYYNIPDLAGFVEKLKKS